MSAQRTYTEGQRELMQRHGYDPDVPYRGVSGPGGTMKGAGDVLLRNRVCYLEGQRIDPHEASDLDVPEDDGSMACIHCRTSFTYDDDFRQVDVPGPQDD